MKKQLTVSIWLFIVFLGIGITPVFSYAAYSERISGQPSAFIISVKKIELKKADGRWITFAEGLYRYDIVKEDLNLLNERFAKKRHVPSGNYSAIRVTLASSFGICYHFLDVGYFGMDMYFTDPSSCTSYVEGGLSNLRELAKLSDISIDEEYLENAAIQYIPLPEGPEIEESLRMANIERLSQNLIRIEAPISIKITSKHKLRQQMSLKLHVAEGVEYFPSSDGLHWFIMPSIPRLSTEVIF